MCHVYRLYKLRPEPLGRDLRMNREGHTHNIIADMFFSEVNAV
jgi:hypothetical protein